MDDEVRTTLSVIEIRNVLETQVDDKPLMVNRGGNKSCTKGGGWLWLALP